MLLWAILLQTVPIKQDHKRVQPALPRLLDLAGKPCRKGGCEPVQRRYRLEVESVLTSDPQQRALRGAWQPCGTTGASICPSKGRMLFRTSL